MTTLNRENFLYSLKFTEILYTVSIGINNDLVKRNLKKLNFKYLNIFFFYILCRSLLLIEIDIFKKCHNHLPS